MEKKYGENSLYADGVSINSTIDPDIQAFADSVARVQVEKVRRRVKYRATRRLYLSKKYNMPEDSVVAHFDSVYTLFKKEYLADDLKRPADKRRFPDSILYHHPEVAAILIENETGAIRAMVGGSDFNQSRWNRAVQSLRQPGSSFKPIVYSTAMDNGASPCDSVNDQPVSIPDPDDKDKNKVWRPANFEHDFEGMMTLRRALYRSKNLPAILTGMKYGLNNVVNYARKFGIVRAPLMAVPSLALGSVGATLMEMTSAYTVFRSHRKEFQGRTRSAASCIGLPDGRHAEGREYSRNCGPCVGEWLYSSEWWQDRYHQRLHRLLVHWLYQAVHDGRVGRLRQSGNFRCRTYGYRRCAPGLDGCDEGTS